MSKFVEHRINTDYLIELSRFCDSDKDISNCRQKLQDEVFRHEWIVAFFKDGAPFFELPFFNKPFMKEQLRLFYLEAHDFLIRFGFVGYYHYKNIESWVEQVTRRRRRSRRRHSSSSSSGDDSGGDDDDDEDDELEEEEMEARILQKFPFGIIPLGVTQNFRYGDYYVVEDRSTMRKTVAFACSEKKLAAKFQFHVINRGATFLPMGEYTREHCMLISMVSSDIVPVSPFADLYMQKRLIREGTKVLFDSNSLRVYPESFIIDKPQKDALIDDIADETLYALDNMLQVKQADNHCREEEGMDNARMHAQRIAMKRNVANSKYTQCNYTQVRKPSTIIMDEKMINDRPSNYEMIQFVPRSVEIVAGKAGEPVVDVDRRTYKYERDVCKAMKVPYAFMNPDDPVSSTSGGGGGGDSNKRGKSHMSADLFDRTQKLLEKEVSDQHTLFSTLFSEVYNRTFSRYDAEIFNAHPESTQFIGAQIGIHFEHVLVKSEVSLSNLSRYYEMGLVPEKEMKRVVFNEFNIQEGCDEGGLTKNPKKKRKL